MNFWTPPVPPWKPLKKTLNSSLRIACIVGGKLYQGLRFEGEIMPLSLGNWKYLLTYGKPDLLLIESFSESATVHWHLSQQPSLSELDELLSIIKYSKKKSVPTVYWLTKGHEYHEEYKDIAKHFDYVFCADPMENDFFKAEGIKAELLLPCVQPAIYNPFRHYEDYNAFNLDLLYDGWADLDRMKDDLNFLQEIKPYGLNIVESSHHNFSRLQHILPEFKDSILGCVTEQSRIQVLRYAKAYITLDKTLSTRTTQQWKTLEAAACRLPVVHHGSLSEDDVRKGAVIECPDQMEFLVEFVRFQEDDLYRERMAHIGWRKTFQEHTFAHRIRKICKTIGIEHDWEEYPKASLITPTFRREYLPHCFQTFKRQKYPNKEMVLVFNGREVPNHSELELEEPRNDIKITNVPGEMFTGACMNVGLDMASGKYCYKIDDDDYYGEHYISDAIQLVRSVDSIFFGKPPSPLYFEEDDSIFRRHRIPKMCIAPILVLNRGKIWIGGNSISVHKDYTDYHVYHDLLYGTVDSAYMVSANPKASVCTILDDFNYYAIRQNTQKKHNWRVDKNKILAFSTSTGLKQNIIV